MAVVAAAPSAELAVAAEPAVSAAQVVLAGGVASFQVGDKVEVVKSRHNPMHHTESYKVGERGVVVHALQNSSVVYVQMEGDYEVVDSVLPLHKVKVPGRTVAASVLHLAAERPPPPPVVDEAAERKAVKGVESKLLPVEEHWLRAIFKRCDSGSDGRVNKQELLQSVQGSRDIAAFFGFASGGEGTEVLEALFKEIAGADEQITWSEFCRFYLKRLSDMAVAAGAAADQEEETMVAAEEAKLRELFDQCQADDQSRVRVAELPAACANLQGAAVLYGLRRRLRRDALQDVVQGAIDGIARALGGDDGDITLVEVMSFAEQEGGEGMSYAEKAWLEALFKKAHASGVHVDKREGEATFVAAEGESMSKSQFVCFCKENPESALMFGLKRQMDQKTLEDATRGALAAVLRSVLRAVAGPDPEDPRVTWEAMRSFYLGGIRNVESRPQ